MGRANNLSPKVTTMGSQMRIIEQWQQAEDDELVYPMVSEPYSSLSTEDLFLLEQAWLLGKLSVATYMRATGKCLCFVRGARDDACGNHPHGYE